MLQSNASAKRVNIQLIRDSGMLALRVADDGVGFHPGQITEGKWPPVTPDGGHESCMGA